MIYPHFRICLIDKNGKVIQTYQSKVKSRIASILTGKKKIKTPILKGQTYVLAVFYAKGFWNKGEYTTKKDAIYDYRCFTEKDLIDEMKDD